MKRVFWGCLLGFILSWNIALAADVYVESSGSCGGNTPCYSTIQAAVNAANSGDIIKVAQGIYAETFVLNSGKQLITQGGWDTEFKNQTPRTTSIRAPVVPNGAIAFHELRIMEIAGPIGNATIADVLSGKTFSSDGGTGLTGTMPNRGGPNFTPTTTDQTIAAGYYDGSGKVEGDANLAAGNIRSGVTIFGVAGSAPAPTGDAVVANVLSGKTFSNTSSTGLTGTMTNNGTGSTITPGTSNQPVAAGYWSSANTVSGDAELVSENIRATKNIFGVLGKTEVVDTTEATNPVEAERMKTGDVGFVNGTKITGTGTQTLSAASNNVAEGYYAETTLSTEDANLAVGNIKKDVQIFGVTGTYPLAGVGKSGQTICYRWNDGAVIPCAGTGQDGDKLKGVTWPNPRFVDNLDGTVTDNMTGLIWLQDANCFGGKSWTNALNDANTLASGSCDLTDSSVAGDWRLPNVKELQSLIDFAYDEPALSNAAGTAKWTTDEDAFSGVQLNIYWSSTTYAHSKANAWYVDLGYGIADDVSKGNAGLVWPVRGGQ